MKGMFPIRLKTYLENVLTLKNQIKTVFARENQISTTEQFISLFLAPPILNIFPNIDDIQKKHLSYLRRYFKVCLLACYMEKKGYDLQIWNEFVHHVYPALQKVPPYKKILIDDFNEGKCLELLILHTINQVFRLPNILALKVNRDYAPTDLLDDYLMNPLSPMVTKKILDKVQVNMKIRGTSEKKIWGDNDILVAAYPENIQDTEIICIISCKTSLRERGYQSIFWATHSRIEGIAKHTFVTLDKGSDKGASEIGYRDATSGHAKKNRDVLEATMDRVYVFRNQQELPRSYVIKDLEYMKKDLARWREDYFGL